MEDTAQYPRRHKIPLYLDQPDHILGTLTVRQVLLISSSLSGAYLFWTDLAPRFSSIWWSLLIATLSIVIASSGIVASFVRYEGRGLESWLVVSFLYLLSPRLFLWTPLHEAEESPLVWDSSGMIREEHIIETTVTLLEDEEDEEA